MMKIIALTTAIFGLALGNANCSLGTANNASTECTASCELLTQAITINATGNGTCTPATHQCVDGENQCVDADCVLGTANNASTEGTASCELLTQAITTAATGNGTCTPATHQCVDGENLCVGNEGGNSAASSLVASTVIIVAALIA